MCITLTFKYTTKYSPWLQAVQSLSERFLRLSVVSRGVVFPLTPLCSWFTPSCSPWSSMLPRCGLQRTELRCALNLPQSRSPMSSNHAHDWTGVCQILGFCMLGSLIVAAQQSTFLQNHFINKEVLFTSYLPRLPLSPLVQNSGGEKDVIYWGPFQSQ